MRLTYLESIIIQTILGFESTTAVVSGPRKKSFWPQELDESRRWLQNPLYDASFQGKNPAFDARDASVADVHEAIFTQQVSCRDVVSSFLSRIEAFNPSVNAIIATNPHTLATAHSIDQMLSNGTLRHYFSDLSLLCVPIMLKDNFDTFDMSTTSGSFALADSQPARDSPTVAALRSAGAIIIGKANLHELALEGLTVSSLGGQTLNPYDLTRTPGGSSGGSGVAVAAGFCVFATGTDTINSLRSPASANSVMSLRPSRGLFTRKGVIPAGRTQDAVGVIARNAADLMLGYRAMWSPEDQYQSMHIEDLDDGLPELGLYDMSVERHPNNQLSNQPLKGIRLKARVTSFDDWSLSGDADQSERKPVQNAYMDFLDALQAAGASVLLERIPSMEDDLSTLDVQAYEFREDLDNYLSDPGLRGFGPRSFEALLERNDYMVIPARYNHIQKAYNLSRSSPGHQETLNKIRNLQDRLVEEDWDSWADSGNLEPRHIKTDFLIYPEQDNLVRKVGAPTQSGRNGYLGALTGFPVLAYPAGFSKPDENAPRGVPVGVEIMGKPLDDMRLLRLAQRLDTIVGGRMLPQLTDLAVPAKVYESVPVVMPNREISNNYPLGRYRD